jgi:DNA-binding transcriptional LysR family regulator
LIAEFHSRHPKVGVTLRDAPFDQINSLVLDGEADIGFGILPEPESGLAGEPLLSNELMLICPAGHPLSKLLLASWHDIIEYPFIALTPENGTRQLAERCAREVGIALKPAYEVSFIWTAIGMVDAGLGVSVIPRFIRSFETAKNIVVRDIAGRKTEPAIALLTRSDVVLAPAAASFRDFVRKYVK